MSEVDPKPEEVTIDEALIRLKNALEMAWRATDSASLSAAQRRKADIVARSLTEEIERILIDEMAQRNKIYDDVAEVMPDLIEPLCESKQSVESMIESVKKIREYVRIIDQLLAVALRFTVE